VHGDGDCMGSANQCPGGTYPGCLYHGGGAPSTCVCLNYPSDVPLGGACSADEQCQHNECPGGSPPGCLFHGVGRSSTCVCLTD
jgi:hypothetical protein